MCAGVVMSDKETDTGYSKSNKNGRTTRKWDFVGEGTGAPVIRQK